MQISSHYPPFRTKTLFVITNNEFARLFSGKDRTIEEIERVESPETQTGERSKSADVSIKQNFDEVKEHRLRELYSALSLRIADRVLHDGFEEVTVCVPEINKNVFTASIAPDVLAHITTVIPKNLASMDEPSIVRILLEG